MAKAAAPKEPVKPLTKTQMIAAIAESTKLSKADVAAVFNSMTDLIKASMGKKGAGVFMIPGLIKVEKKVRPKTAARKNVPNPFKPGEFRDIPAKPATNVVKVRALKALKDMVTAK